MASKASPVLEVKGTHSGRLEVWIQGAVPRVINHVGRGQELVDVSEEDVVRVGGAPAFGIQWGS